MKKFAVIIAVLSACVYSGAGIAMDQKEVGMGGISVPTTMPNLPEMPKAPTPAPVKVEPTKTGPEKTDFMLSEKKELVVKDEKSPVVNPDQGSIEIKEEIKQETKNQVGKEIHIANTDETDEEMNKLIASLAERAMKKVNEKAQKQLEENIRTAIDKAIDEMASKVAGS